MQVNGEPINRRVNANVFVKNLEPEVKDADLMGLFANFGPIVSCKVAVDYKGVSKGHGFIHFEADAAAKEAINVMNGKVVRGREMYVGPFIRRQDREGNNGKYCNVYVKNLSDTVSEDVLRHNFGKFGKITSVVVMRDQNGKSRGFGFVNFDSAEEAMKAVEQLDGYVHDDQAWTVTKAQTKAEREAELRQKQERERREKQEKLAASNLYVKNLMEDIDDDRLKSIFQDFGTITSCRVLRDDQGKSRCVGFVQFASVEEASRAIEGMNGRQVGAKTVYVAVAQRKADRQKRMKNFYSFNNQMMPPAAYVQNLQFYPAAYPGPFYFGSPPMFPAGHYPAAVPRMFPGVRPGVPGAGVGAMSMPPMSVPAGGYFVNWVGQDGVMQQYHPYQNGRTPMAPARAHSLGSNSTGSKASKPTSSPHANGISSPVRSSETVATMLQNAPQDQHRNILGEALYPRVERMTDATSAPKITGMLLEMSEVDILKLLDDTEALNEKVTEALSVLKGSGPARSVGNGAARASAEASSHVEKITQNLQEMAF